MHNWQAPKPFASQPAMRTLTGFSTPNLIYNSEEYVGRWFLRYINNFPTMTSITAGAEIRTKVKNTTTVKALFHIPSYIVKPYIAVQVDNGPFTVVQVDSEVVVVSGISLLSHTIRLVVAGIHGDEPTWSGNGVIFKGFKVDPGGAISPNGNTAKKILFLGDSITAGKKILGSTEAPTSHAGHLAYPKICANTIGATAIQVAFGGSGVTIGGRAGEPKAIDNFPYYMNGILCPKTKEIPDVVVINHGTNDGGATASAFDTAYREFVDLIRSWYPTVPIFVISPFIQTSRISNLQQISAAYSDCYFVDTAGWAVTYTDGIHPNTNGHDVAGKNLANVITSALGSSFFSV